MKRLGRKSTSKTSSWEKSKDLFTRLLDNANFQKQIYSLRKKWNIPDNGYENGYDWVNWIHQLSLQRQAEGLQDPVDELTQDTDKLMLDFKIGEKWRTSINEHLLYNSLVPTHPVTKPSVSIPSDNSIEAITIHLDANTSREELLNAWDEVQESKERSMTQKGKKYQPIQNYDTYKKAYELSNKKIPHKEIAVELDVPAEYVSIYADRYKEIITRNQ